MRSVVYSHCEQMKMVPRRRQSHDPYKQTCETKERKTTNEQGVSQKQCRDAPQSKL